MQNPELLKSLLEQTKVLCSEHNLVIESEDDLYYYLNIFFDVSNPKYDLTPEEEDLRLTFKHQGL